MTVMIEEAHELYADISQVTIDTYTAIQGSVQKRNHVTLIHATPAKAIS